MEEKKSSGGKCLLILLIIIAIGIFGFLSLQNWYISSINDPFNSEAIELDVIEGETFSDVLAKLSEGGHIGNTLPIEFYLKTNSINPNIKIGSYLIPEGYNIPELIETLEQGVFKPAIWVTIKEGLTYEAISEQLEKEISEATFYSVSDFQNLIENPDQIVYQDSDLEYFIESIVPEGNSLRGFIYPDTYRIDQDMSTSQVLEMFLANFKRKMELNLPEINSYLNGSTLPSGLTLYEGMVLGSIIEKEASAWDDRAEISGIFHNRLNEGMALQSDATVNFVTGKNDAGVNLQDQNVKSPYNTYVNTGLPPTPINNPRIESIIAGLKPNDTEYVYFYHTPDGKTFYNVTYNDHLSGVCRDLGC